MLFYGRVLLAAYSCSALLPSPPRSWYPGNPPRSPPDPPRPECRRGRRYSAGRTSSWAHQPGTQGRRRRERVWWRSPTWCFALFSAMMIWGRAIGWGKPFEKSMSWNRTPRTSSGCVPYLRIPSYCQLVHCRPDDVVSTTAEREFTHTSAEQSWLREWRHARRASTGALGPRAAHTEKKKLRPSPPEASVGRTGRRRLRKFINSWHTLFPPLLLLSRAFLEHGPPGVGELVSDEHQRDAERRQVCEESRGWSYFSP